MEISEMNLKSCKKTERNLSVSVDGKNYEVGSHVQFKPLTRKLLSKYIETPTVDVDSYVVVAKHLGAFCTGGLPFIVRFGKDLCFAKKCQNVKLTRALKNAKRSVWLEFSLQEPSSGVPVYVLMMFEKITAQTTDHSESSDSESAADGDYDVNMVMNQPWRQLFIEAFLQPAFSKLGRHTKSVVHHGGCELDLTSSKGTLQVFSNDFQEFAEHVYDQMDKPIFENCHFMFYTAKHGLQMELEAFTKHLSRSIETHHLSIKLFQVHLAVTFRAHSNCRTVKCNRKKLLSAFKRPTVYCAHLCFDEVYFNANECRVDGDQLPFSTYYQAYDPAVYRVNRVDSVTPFAWVALGGPALAGSRYDNLRNLNYASNTPNLWRSYLQSCIEGPPLRLEVVISDHMVTTVMGLLPSYGQRIVSWVVHHQLLSISSKLWPFHVANTLKVFIDGAIKTLHEVSNRHYNKQLFARLYDLQCLIGHFISGKMCRSDSVRLKTLLPMHQVSVGSHSLAQRNQLGCITVKWEKIGDILSLKSAQIWEKLPMPFDRVVLSVLFNSLDEGDVLSKSPEEVADWWILVLGRFVAEVAGIAKPRSWRNCFWRQQILLAFSSREATDTGYMRLSLEGLVPPSDVLQCLTKPSTRVTDIVRQITTLRDDYADVVKWLSRKVEEIEVFPIKMLLGASDLRYYDWINVGKSHPRDRHQVEQMADQLAIGSAELGFMERRPLDD